MQNPFADLIPQNKQNPYQITQPLDPNVAQGRELDVRRDQVGLAGDAISNEKARYDVRAKPVYDRFGAFDKLGDNVRNDKRVQSYEGALPVWASALKAPESPEGDTMLVNAFAKTLDPTTGVQQREGDAIAAAAPTYEQMKSRLLKEFGSDGAGNFTAEGRKRIKETITVRMKALATGYNAARDYWRNYIKASGVPDVEAETILGKHFGADFQQYEADYKGRPIRNLDGSPGAVPTKQKGLLAAGQGDIGFAGASDENPFTPEQQARYNAFWQAYPNASDGQLQSFIYNDLGIKDRANVEAIIRARDAGAGVRNAADAEWVQPDISDKRGNHNPIAEDVDAFMRGVADIPTFGTADELAAGADTIFNGGTMRQNLAEQRGVDSYDAANNPYARFSGQLAGGFLLPLGEMQSLGQFAGKGAAVGAGYGFGSGEGGLGERVANAALGAGAGALAGGGLFGLGKAGQRIFSKGAEEVPPLVDPLTGRLNQPLESVSPAQRVAAAREFKIDLPLGAAGDRTAAILEKGLDIMPASAGVMNDARRVTGAQVDDAVDLVAGGYGGAANLYAGGQAAQRGANNWISRFEELSTKAYEAIPIKPDANAALSSTRAALDELSNKFGSNWLLANTMRNPKLENIRNALSDDTGLGLSWKDLKDLRSHIGEQIGDNRFSDGSRISELKHLYGALTKDMRATAIAQGPKALRAFERANDLYAQGQQRIEKALVTILGDDAMQNPEAAAMAIQKIAKSGRASASLDQLKQIRASMAKGDEWGEVASSLIRMMGQPVNSPGREFNPRTFIHNYADMDEAARNLLFGDRGRAELRKTLDSFVAVNQRLEGTNALRNTSQTAGSLTAVGSVGGVGASVVNPLLGLKLAAGAALNYGMAKLWTNPGFVRWATGYTKSIASGNANAIKGQAGRLRTLAAQNPALRGEIETLERSLISAANDNLTHGVAASEPDQGRNY